MKSQPRKPRFVRIPALPDLGKCESCGKRRFTYENARQVAFWQRRDQDTNHHEYQCPEGRDWHVGSSTRLRLVKSHRTHRQLPQINYWKEAA